MFLRVRVFRRVLGLRVCVVDWADVRDIGRNVCGVVRIFECIKCGLLAASGTVGNNSERCRRPDTACELRTGFINEPLSSTECVSVVGRRCLLCECVYLDNTHIRRASECCMLAGRELRRVFAKQHNVSEIKLNNVVAALSLIRARHRAAQQNRPPVRRRRATHMNAVYYHTHNSVFPCRRVCAMSPLFLVIGVSAAARKHDADHRDCAIRRDIKFLRDVLRLCAPSKCSMLWHSDRIAPPPSPIGITLTIRGDVRARRPPINKKNNTQ